MRNVFITFTPYHILLSCAIAFDKHAQEENYLFVISDFDEAGALIKAMEGWSGCPFAEIESLPGVYGKASMFRRRFTVRRNIAAISKSVKEDKIDRVFVCHDERAEAQAALHFAKKGNKNTVGVYVEDGAGAYSSYRSTKRPLHKLLLGKLFYGPWWADVSVLGTSRWIDEVKAIFPQLVRPELRLKCVTSVPKHVLLELRNQGWLFKYLETLGVRVGELSSLDAVLIVKHSEFARGIPGYGHTINETLAIAKIQGLRLAIKYHPREFRGDFLSVGNSKGITVLPQSLPVELLYIITSKQIKFIIGDISTSLLTAKWLLNNAAVISIALLLDQTDPKLLKTFRKLGIKVVENIAEIWSIVRQ